MHHQQRRTWYTAVLAEIPAEPERTRQSADRPVQPNGRNGHLLSGLRDRDPAVVLTEKPCCLLRRAGSGPDAWRRRERLYALGLGLYRDCAGGREGAEYLRKRV